MQQFRAKWGWAYIVKAVLCGSEGFPTTESEVWMINVWRVMGQLRFLREKAMADKAQAEVDQRAAEREAKAKEAARAAIDRAKRR